MGENGVATAELEHVGVVGIMQGLYRNHIGVI